MLKSLCSATAFPHDRSKSLNLCTALPRQYNGVSVSSITLCFLYAQMVSVPAVAFKGHLVMSDQALAGMM